jgi:hypothetical protein
MNYTLIRASKISLDESVLRLNQFPYLPCFKEGAHSHNVLPGFTYYVTAIHTFAQRNIFKFSTLGGFAKISR